MVTALRARLGDQASISGGSERIFVYTNTAASAAALAQEARDVTAQHGVASPEWVRTEVWLPTAERWADGTDVPRPHRPRVRERGQVPPGQGDRTRGDRRHPTWRVKITLPSGHEARLCAST